MTQQTTEQITDQTTEQTTEQTHRVLQRQVLPLDRDLDVMPLYVDPNPAPVGGDDTAATGAVAQQINVALRSTAVAGGTIHPDQVESRTAVRVGQGEMLSFGTYFNAFPASYWRRWTIVSQVRLTVRLRGRGATVIVYKSMANGRQQRVDAGTTGEDSSGTFTFDLTLKPFIDGGWYWYNVVAGDEDVVVEDAAWSAPVPEDRVPHGTADIAITTMNRPDFCAKLLAQIAEDDYLRPFLDTVLVMEQGTQKVVDSEYYPQAEKAFTHADGSSTLQVIEQGNLGGSGGYARGQLESLRKGTATYAMMMDDDVVCEPEGVIRAIVFADLCRRPTIVGGHMFSLFAKSRLHSFGEVVQPWRFWWQSAEGVENDWDFSAHNLRSARWLHRRVDVDYNGWFMCLIPRVVMEEIGLSLPVFIKWDDSEYGLRASAAGYPTVTLPGAAVWHVPWTDKNDALDWQSYFHQRNRFIAALLHSVYDHGGRMVTESFNHQIKHLVSMQYSTVELRHQALEDLLAGPEHLHEVLATRLPEIRATAKEFHDAQLESDRDVFPPVRRHKPPRKGREGGNVSTGLGAKLAAVKAPLRQLVKPRPLSRHYPESEVAAMDAKWFRIARYDSAIVSMNDGQSAAFYQRDPERFRELMKKTVAIHARLRKEWPRLAEEYRAKLPQVVSPEAWEDTFRPWTEEPAEEPKDD